MRGKDLYSRAVLTVIAVCLLTLCLNELALLPSAYAQDTAGGDVLEARGLVIVDADGQKRIWLGTDGPVPKILLYDKNGQERIKLGVTDVGECAIAQYNPKGEKTTEWRVNEHSVGQLGFKEDGVYRVRLAVIPGHAGGAAWLELHHTDGGRAEIRTMSRGTPDITLSDANGTMRANLGILGNGVSTLNLFDPENRGEASLYISPDAESGLSLVDHEKRSRAVLGSDFDPRKRAVVSDSTLSRLRLYDENKKVLWSAPE